MEPLIKFKWFYSDIKICNNNKFETVKNFEVYEYILSCY